MATARAAALLALALPLIPAAQGAGADPEPSVMYLRDRRIVTNYFPRSKTKITDIAVGRADYADLLAEIHTAKWEDVVLFRFVRSSSAVGELVLRDLHARIKDLHAGRGLCICAGTYSESAIAFVEARLIDLINKEDLTKLLKRV